MSLNEVKVKKWVGDKLDDVIDESLEKIGIDFDYLDKYDSSRLLKISDMFAQTLAEVLKANT